ncbi:MAG: type II toxin-antitoxin system VapC family toxin [Proteobacteria bacterium]|jgi:tRNA(fMet)-specific endonuclease VapC|nr:type II toxin-antitoxin system VapC family toxin [Ramlibacter sp.]MCA0215225.1 type II toxin-antitoxin system VapC family toxin [Pseudomonadota bacterium]
MAGRTYLLDTNVISRIMKDALGPDALQYRARLRREPDCEIVTSVVVQCELLFGLARRPSPRLQTAYELQMRQIPVLPLDESVSTHYGRLRARLEQAGTPVGGNDTLIAAHALALGATLVTSDTEFARIAGLATENWFQQNP